MDPLFVLQRLSLIVKVNWIWKYNWDLEYWNFVKDKLATSTSDSWTLDGMLTSAAERMHFEAKKKKTEKLTENQLCPTGKTISVPYQV